MRKEKFKPEKKEKEPQYRHVEVHIFRHGEAEGEKREAHLTKEGRKQSMVAAENLLKNIKAEGGGVIKIFYSPLVRALETAKIFEEAINKLLQKEPDEFQGTHLMKTHPREKLTGLGAYGELKKRGIEDPVEYWLQNPKAIKGKNPELLAERLLDLTETAQRVASKIGPGEPVHYVWVTHEMPIATLLHKVSGKTLKEFGGSVKNCEELILDMARVQEENPKLEFRGEKFTTPLDLKESN